MRTLRPTPLIRVVRSQRRPCSSARELWKERLENHRQQQSAALTEGSPDVRRSTVENVPSGRADANFPREEAEAREPSASYCAPLKEGIEGQGQHNLTSHHDRPHQALPL